MIKNKSSQRLQSIFLVLAVCFILAFSSNVAAADFDNVKSYDEETQTVTVNNCDFWLGTCLNEGETIGTAQLETPIINQVGIGYVRVAELDILAFQEYEEVIKYMNFYDKTQENWEDSPVEIEYDLKYKAYETVELENYYENCSEDGSDCNYIFNGTTEQVNEVWLNLTETNFNINENKTIGIYTTTYEGQHVEWIPKIYGVEVEEFAEWNASLEVDLVAYYNYNSNSDDQYAENDGTWSNPSGFDYVTGILGNAVNLTDANFMETGLGFGQVDITINYWWKPYNLVGAGQCVTYNSGSFRICPDSGSGGQYYFYDTSFRSLGKTNTTLNSWRMDTYSFNHATHTLTLYSNGVKVSDTVFDSSATLNNFTVSAETTAWTKSTLDELAIWNRTVTQNDVDQLWNNGLGITLAGSFGTAPNVGLVSPVDQFNTTSASIEFNVTVTDSQLVENVTLFLDGVANETNTSQVNGTYIFNKDVSEGYHNWSILAWNNQSQFNQSETRFFNYTAPIDDLPQITLTSPVDEFNTTVPIVEFITTVTDNILVQNVSLVIDEVIVETNTSQVNGSYTFNYPVGYGYHNWSIIAFDNASQSNQSEYRNLNYTGVNPEVELLLPVNNSNISMSPVTFTADVTDELKVQNVSIFLDGVLNQTNSSGINGSYTFSIDLDEGYHNWSILAYDNHSLGTQSETRFFNYTIIDISIDLFSPANNSIELDQTVNISCNAYQQMGILQLNATVNGEVIISNTNSTPLENLTISEDYNFTDGDYVWNCTAKNEQGVTTSSTNLFTVHTVGPTIDITAPTGNLTYFELGDNETLTYNISEAGQSDSHFDSCWYVYEDLQSINNTSNYLIGSFHWNFRNGSMTSSGSEDTLFVNEWFASGVEFLDTAYSTNGVEISQFQEDIPNCISESYSNSANYTNSTIGYYACVKNNENKYSIINQLDFIIGAEYQTNFSAYDISYNLNCTANEDTFEYINNKNLLKIFSIDTYGFIGSESTSWGYKLLKIAETFDTSIIEGSPNQFNVNLSIASGYAVENITFSYDNVTYASSYSEYETDNFFASISLTAPSVSGPENKTFFWNVTYSDDSSLSTPEQNQTVVTFSIDDCSVLTYLLFNFTIVDEDTQSFLDGTSKNVTTRADIKLYNIDTDELIINYSNLYSQTNPALVCLSSDIGNSTYRLEGVIEYKADDRFSEFYNFRNYTLTQDTDAQNITLYNLNSSLGQEFKITYKDANFNLVPGALIQIQRKYIDEGVFKTVEIPVISSAGYTIAHLVRNDIIYNLLVIDNGELVASFNDVVADCQNPSFTECQINVNSFSSGINPSDYSTDSEFTSVISYDKETRIVSTNFAVLSGLTATNNLNVVLWDSFGNTTVCNDTVIASGGTLSCTVPDAFGNSSIIIKVNSNDVQKRYAVVTLQQDPEDIYGANLVFLSLTIILFIIGMSITDNPVFLGVMLVLGTITLMVLNLVASTGWIGGGATILWFIVGIVILLVKGGNRQ